MENKYFNYIDALLRLYECDKEDISYSFNRYIEYGIIIKGENGNYTVSDGERGSYFDTRFFNSPNEVVYEVMRRLGMDIPVNDFYLLRDKFLELNKDLVEELLSNKEEFTKETMIRNDIYQNNKNIYYDITMMNIANFLNESIPNSNQRKFIANIIYALFVLKPKKTLEEELIKTLEYKKN